MKGVLSIALALIWVFVILPVVWQGLFPEKAAQGGWDVWRIIAAGVGGGVLSVVVFVVWHLISGGSDDKG